MKVLNVIGMDPSLTNWGIVIATLTLDPTKLTITEMKLIETKKSKVRGIRVSSDRLDRGRTIVSSIAPLIKKTNIIFSEIPTGSQSAVSSFGLGIATGILSAIHIPIIQVLPHETKLSSVGRKTASKQDMIDWAVTKHPEAAWLLRNKSGSILKKNEHLADAIAVIYAGLETDQFKQLISLQG